MIETKKRISSENSSTWAFDQIGQLIPSFPAQDYLLIGVALSIAAIVCFVFYKLKNSGGKKKRRKPGAYKAKRILTNNETEFYGRLLQALPEYTILSQVSMSALIEPRAENGSEYMGKRAKFSQKFVDFVICEPRKLKVICIVELDDITHDAAKDAARDEMLEGAGYVVVRWHSRTKPSVAEINKSIRKIHDQKLELFY